MEVMKPWVHTKKYQADRFKEALYEAELAERFLEDSLLKNSAEKAYQALKAYVVGLAINYRDLLLQYYPGKRTISAKKVVERVDWIIATMPRRRLSNIKES
ncbi:hypothetical protein EWF20_05465 [Sulfolobus sp. S-194]|uniref:PaREP1 family protein n=1 Tax=Sulfolobus sp. S-194 TaxID=2512240 RepID=UPI001436DA43|nr:PaREP1 family protein [Sulfolobus sp. S-194]QIW23660.1 hypothetical protein EWF20_05465 [Sulfolobus sp. S-194]